VKEHTASWPNSILPATWFALLGSPIRTAGAVWIATRLIRFTLLGGLIGCAAMFSLETWISVIAYPENIGGRPLYSWPAFIVPAYEWTILWAAFSAGIGMIALNRMPSLYHPVFNAPNFRDGATTDKFFLCLEALDPKFDVVEARKYLETFKPLSVVEVEY
jgi:hypothetical protein